MKKLILSMAAVAALASCSNDESNVAPELDAKGTPIAVTAGIETSVDTKAPVTGTAFTDGASDLFRLVAYKSTDQVAPSDFNDPSNPPAILSV